MEEASDTVRLQKWLAQLGLASRREAETWIEDKLVMVNGKVAQLGQKIDPCKDNIVVLGKAVPKHVPQKLTLVMHKPKGVICSNADEFHQGKTVFDLLPRRYQKQRLFCVGRLDKDSEGLLLLTNDGELANAIMHPSSGIVKRYQVKLNKPFDPKKIPLFIKGVKDEGEHLSAKEVIPAMHGPEKEKCIEILLVQGRKREIRRLCECLGYFVKKLKRVQIGQFVMKGLGPGEVRELNEKELALLLKK